MKLGFIGTGEITKAVVIGILGSKLRVKKIYDLNIMSGVIIGFFQILAFLPGTSRSGICITAARFLGFDRESAAKFSLLLSIPAILGASVLEAYDLVKLNDYELKIIMRSVYLQNALNQEDNIQEQISILNNIVLDYCVKQITSQVMQFINYQKEINSNRYIMPHSMNTNSSGEKTLEMKIF